NAERDRSQFVGVQGARWEIDPVSRLERPRDFGGQYDQLLPECWGCDGAGGLRLVRPRVYGAGNAALRRRPWTGFVWRKRSVGNVERPASKLAVVDRGLGGERHCAEGYRRDEIFRADEFGPSRNDADLMRVPEGGKVQG